MTVQKRSRRGIPDSSSTWTAAAESARTAYQLNLHSRGGSRVEQLQLLRLGELELGHRQHELTDAALGLVLAWCALQKLQRLQHDTTTEREATSLSLWYLKIARCGRTQILPSYYSLTVAS